MNAYVVADQRWAFGRNGGLLFSLPTDLEHFHALTRNGTVIMGPERLVFFTGGAPLPQRRNIIVSRDLSALPEGAEGVTSPDGRVFGKMGHSERIGDRVYLNVDGEKDMKLFRGAVEYFR